MPFFFSERLPVPTLKSYICLSVVLFLFSIIFWKNGYWLNSGDDEPILRLDYIISEPFILWVSLYNLGIIYLLFTFYIWSCVVLFTHSNSDRYAG